MSIERITRAAAMVSGAGMDGLLVTAGSDLRYLTGYTPIPLERLTMLIVAPGRDPVMVVPALERPGAVASPAGAQVEVLGWTDAEDPYALVARFLAPGRYAITDQTWASHVLGLRRGAPAVSLEPAGKVLPLLRAVKDEEELQALRAAGAAADASFAEIVRTTFEGRRELDVARDLADLLCAHGHETAEFTIVGSGPNGASPHHEASDRVIGAGDVVVLDFGGRRHGYWSDITRTVVVGEPSPEAVEVHATVRAAQQAGFEAVRPGDPCQDVDRAARAVIEQAGFGDRFIHRTGHGIGMELHEPPYIVKGNDTPLEPGMTFSIEPGIYLPERFGVRIEDIVAVTREGAERLNGAPRDLTVVS